MSIKEKIKEIPFLKSVLKKLYLKNKAETFEKVSKKEKPDPKLVLFESFQGRGYSCSPKAIYEYMQKSPEFKDYRYVWVFRDLKAHGEFPENTTLVKFDSAESFKYYAKAGTWIVNSRLRDFITPAKGQRYVQCWHGTPFKKIGCDIEAAGNATSTTEEIYNEYTNEAKKISLMLSPSPFCTEKLVSAFNLKSLSKENIIIEKGYPRNDALFTFDDEKVKGIKAHFGIPENKKVILYCPTFRDNQYGGEGYKLKLALDFESLRQNCGDDFVILFRAHYFIADRFDFDRFSGYVLNASDYDDINDLYIISDILVTDYSSVFFDYANLNRPILFYLYDVSEYMTKMRDFYFGTAMLPGFTAQTQPKLEACLNSVLEDMRNGGDGLLQYKAAMEAFRKKFSPLDSADCAERVAGEIFSSGDDET